MNNYGESCMMTWPLAAVKRWDIFCENWSLEGELRSNGASTTQNCLEKRVFWNIKQMEMVFP